MSKAASPAGEHTGFQIAANGVTWEIDASAAKPLTQAAEQLEGKVALVTGSYSEQQDGSHVRRILTPEKILSGSSKGRGEYIDVTVHGTLNSGVMAIGAETTGVTITAGAVTWELELQRDQRRRALKLSGSKVIVSGQLRREDGVEVRHRLIVKVRNIKPLIL